MRKFDLPELKSSKCFSHEYHFCYLMYVVVKRELPLGSFLCSLKVRAPNFVHGWVLAF